MKFNKIDNFNSLFNAITPEISVDPKTGKREVKLTDGEFATLNQIARKVKELTKKLGKKDKFDAQNIEFGYKICTLVNELDANGKKEIDRLEASDTRFFTIRIRNKILSFFANLFSNPKKDILSYQKKHFPYTPPKSEPSFTSTHTSDKNEASQLIVESQIEKATQQEEMQTSEPAAPVKTPPLHICEAETIDPSNLSESSDSGSDLETSSPKKSLKLHFATLSFVKSAKGKLTLKRTCSVGAPSRNQSTLKPLKGIKIPPPKSEPSLITTASNELKQALATLTDESSPKLLEIKKHWLDPNLIEILPVAFVALEDTPESVELKKLVPSLQKITMKMYLDEAKEIFLRTYNKKSITEIQNDEEIDHTPLEFFMFALLLALEEYPTQFREKPRDESDWRILKSFTFYFDDRAQIGKGRCSPKFILCPSAANPDQVCLKLIDHPDVFYYPVDAFAATGPIFNGLKKGINAKFFTKKGQAKRDAEQKKKELAEQRKKDQSIEPKEQQSSDSEAPGGNAFDTMVKLDSSNEKSQSSDSGDGYGTTVIRRKPDSNYVEPTFDFPSKAVDSVQSEETEQLSQDTEVVDDDAGE